MRFATDHAIERIQTRYGLTPTDSDWRDAFLDIVEGRSLLLAYVGSRERRIIRVAGKAVHAVYNPNTAEIITVLPAGRRRRS